MSISFNPRILKLLVSGAGNSSGGDSSNKLQPAYAHVSAGGPKSNVSDVVQKTSYQMSNDGSFGSSIEQEIQRNQKRLEEIRKQIKAREKEWKDKRYQYLPGHLKSLETQLKRAEGNPKKIEQLNEQKNSALVKQEAAEELRGQINSLQEEYESLRSVDEEHRDFYANNQNYGGGGMERRRKLTREQP